MTKILIVDDEPSIINLVSAYLKPEGYDVYTATDGNAGLKAARTFKPDLLILDLMLPGIDGIELLSRLRRESDVYVIMLTARTDETDKIVGLSVGADDFGESNKQYSINVVPVGRRGARSGRRKRDSHCSQHPSSSPRRRWTTIEAIARSVRASGCRPEGWEFESPWPRSISRSSGAYAALHTPRAGGTHSTHGGP